MTRAAGAAGLLAVALAGWPSTADAYRTVADTPEVSGTERVRWLDATVSYEIHERTPLGVPLADYERAVRLGFARWTDVACSELVFAHGGLTGATASPEDGRVTVEAIRGEWAARGFSTDVAAVTDATYVRGDDGVWRIADADILLNDDDFEWEADGAPAGSTLRDLQAVITHEAGHCLGLAHVCEVGGVDGAPDCDTSETFAETTMYPIYRGAEQRTLHADDREGLCFLYPAGACDDRTCPAGMTCTEDGCVAVCGDETCALGEVCTPTGCGPADCTDCAGGPDDPCASDAECAAGELCDRGVCVADLGAAGDPCVEASECRSGLCSRAGYCTSPCSAELRCPEDFTCDAAASECTAEAGVFGAECRRAPDCLSGICLEGAEPEPICSRRCGEGISSCPAGFVCGEVSGKDVCRPPPPGAGCMAAGGRSRQAPLAALVFMTLALIWRRALGGAR